MDLLYGRTASEAPWGVPGGRSLATVPTDHVATRHEGLCPLSGVADTTLDHRCVYEDTTSDRL